MWLEGIRYYDIMDVMEEVEDFEEEKTFLEEIDSL